MLANIFGHVKIHTHQEMNNTIRRGAKHTNTPGRKLDGGNLQEKTEGNPARKREEN